MWQELPKIVSVDDHVVEPPGVWQDRLPAKLRPIGPRVVRAPIKDPPPKGGGLFLNSARANSMLTPAAPNSPGEPVDWWFFEDLRVPFIPHNGSVGHSRDEIVSWPVTYDWYRPGAYQMKARLEDMDLNWTEASLCFPNAFPRFCGQTFSEAKDRDLGLLCIRAYNDWMLDEWCAGSGGRLIPLIIIPLWEPELAAEEVRRNAFKGCRAVAFSENPTELGYPSIHRPDRHWDPFFEACQETDSVICMHIGSSSKLWTTSADAPPAVTASLNWVMCCGSVVDWLMSGVFVRFPTLKVVFAEGQVGWMPYVLDRADAVFRDHFAWHGAVENLPVPPSELFRDHVFGCVFNDQTGLRLLDVVGRKNVMFEVDYPHSDSTWPRSRETATTQLQHLSDAEVFDVVRGNAIRLFDLQLD